MDVTHPDPLAVDFTVTAPIRTVSLARIERLLSFVAEREGVGGDLGVWLCTDDEIADLHLRYMAIEGPTDVITFPGDEPGSGGHAGDIAVSVDTAAIQARDAGHSLGREIAYLCLHGLLHLARYDDLDDDSRHQMLRRQEDLLNEFERDRPDSWNPAAEREPGDDGPQRGRSTP
jgi:probable rRNA maturation factor